MSGLELMELAAILNSLGSPIFSVLDFVAIVAGAATAWLAGRWLRWDR